MRILDLVVAVDGVVELRPVEIALRLADVDIGYQGAEVIDVQAIGREFLRVRLDPHRRDIAARRRHQTHSRHLGNLGAQAVVGDVLQLRQGHGVGGDCQRQNRLIRRIDLRVGRRRRQSGGQQAVGRVDRLLDILFGHIEVQRSANCSVMIDAPAELLEVICCKPGISPNCTSRGAVTVVAITVGLAPG